MVSLCTSGVIVHLDRGLSIMSGMCHCWLSAQKGHGTNEGLRCVTYVTAMTLLLAGNSLREPVS